ncbi:uncharacterized protein LOC135389198 [Ornithodoros turicata]|uniref:uncharacterized protein LOC135389198 n=1 Tax=Ornithodoros turicata TaxID=34597 RepID=UPI003138AD35
MHAFVKYVDDGMEAVLPVNLIKDFRPATTNGCKKVIREAFWCDEDGELAGYYSAEVKMLAETEDLLIQTMLAQNIAIPRILRSDCASGVPTEGTPPTKKQRRLNEKVSRNRDMRRIMSKEGEAPMAAAVIPVDTPTQPGSDAQMGLLQSAQELRAAWTTLNSPENATDMWMHEPVTVCHQETCAEPFSCTPTIDSVARNEDTSHSTREYQKMMPHPPDQTCTTSSTPIDSQQRNSTANIESVTGPRQRPKAASCVQGKGKAQNRSSVPLLKAVENKVTASCLQVESCVQPHSPTRSVDIVARDEDGSTSTVESQKLMPRPPGEPCTASSTPTYSQQNRSTANVEFITQPHQRLKPRKGKWVVQNTSSVPLLKVVENKVHMGNDIYVSQEKLTWEMESNKDSRFCRDMSRLVWTDEELHGRSVTGKACNRFAKEGAVPKPPLTPVKVQAVFNGYHHFVLSKETPAPSPKRINSFALHMRSFLNDLNKEQNLCWSGLQSESHSKVL